MANQKKGVYCPHYHSNLRRRGCYFYDLVGMTIWICEDCNQKLFKAVIKQKTLEDNLISTTSKSVKTPQSSSSLRAKSVRRTTVCGTVGTKRTKLKQKKVTEQEVDEEDQEEDSMTDILNQKSPPAQSIYSDSHPVIIDVDSPVGYLSRDMALDKYGSVTLKKMEKTGWLDGVTGIMLNDGTLAIPESDYERAYRAVKGERISSWEAD